MSNFQPLDVVDRGSETQPQVVGNLNYFSWKFKLPYPADHDYCQYLLVVLVGHITVIGN